MKKLIKLSETHYIIVDESEIKEGNWYYNNKVLFLSDQVFDDGNNPNQNKANKKITHSTQPLESKFSSIIYRGYYHISISEVEEAIYGYSVEKLAESANGYAVYGKPLGEKYLAFNEGYQSGFNAHKELVKDKLFDDEVFDTAIQVVGSDKVTTIREFIQSLLPKSEWEVEFDEQGKLKLI